MARRAGVSTTTVSHVVSGKRPVGAASAALVRAAMDELGYVPNHAAASLRRGMARTVGLVVPDISNPYFAELAKGAEDAAAALDFNLVLCNTSFKAEREERYLDVLRSGGVDGMAYLAGAPPDTAVLRRMSSFPLVLVDEEIAELGVDSVVSDNDRGGELAGRHLSALGHEAILVIDGPPELATARLRRAGFERAVGDGKRVESRRGDYRRESGHAAIRDELEERGAWFTAVFATNDLMALGALDGLREAGLAIPADVSLVGFDDAVFAELVTPALTTVRQPVYEMGRVAVDLLVARVRGTGPGGATTIVLPVQMVERASTAHPRTAEGAP